LPLDQLKWVKFSGISWTKDGKGFFYSRFDAPKSQDVSTMDKAGVETDKLGPQKVYYHRVGTKQEEDVLVYMDEKQEEWMFDAQVSNDGKFLLFDVRKDCNEINLLYYVELTPD